MKKTITICLFIAFAFIAQAQFITPGDGATYSMSDLVNISSGVVTYDGNEYFIHHDITIATGDLLEILENIVIKVAAGKRININGTLIVDPPDEVLFTAIESGQHFRGFRFDNASDASMMKQAIVEYAGGIQLIGTDMLFDNCTIRYFDMSNTSAAINLHNSNPVIQHCLFLENAGSAIGSGANIQTSPSILYNTLISNGTANTNRPQINMGPASADTIKIIGNHIQGEYAMAGGIAVSNSFAVGHTIALIKDNVVINNRYGYTGQGGQITSILQNNQFIDNNIQGQPMLGGSGLNFVGSATNQALVQNNVIRGNLWGVTIQSNAQPNLGEIGNENTGYNVIEDNVNTGIIYGLYNNTPGAIFAQNNYWGTDDEDVAAGYIIDLSDDMSLGPVTFLPMWVPGNLIEQFVFEDHNNPGLDQDVAGSINQDEQSIYLVVPGGTDLTALVPTIIVSDHASVTPESEQTIDFSESVHYTVTGFHGENRIYIVIVEVATIELFTVSFEVFDDAGNSIDDAVITLGGIENEPGNYFFEQIGVGSYSYTVQYTCFATNVGEVFVSEDELVQVVLTGTPGDANGDGLVNVLDVISITNYFIGYETELFCFGNADLNNDMVINILDVINTVYLFLE